MNNTILILKRYISELNEEYKKTNKKHLLRWIKESQVKLIKLENKG